MPATEDKPKSLFWMGPTKEVLSAFPQAVKYSLGYALFQAQLGTRHPAAKPLKGFGTGVLEAVSNHDGNTYRAVYMVRFRDSVYVLHAFQKKAKKGIATPKRELDVIRGRLRQAQAHHETLQRRD